MPFAALPGPQPLGTSRTPYSRSPLAAKLEEHRATDFYALLSVSPSATSADIKTAYHRALLASHPDKRDPAGSNPTDIGLLKQAFNTLYTPYLRKHYDALRTASRKSSGPRPAQVISLEEFEETEDTSETSFWVYSCRCGGQYVVTEETLDAGQHLVGCASCSEVVWVGYELVEDADADALQAR
ncbi:hypothetical protein BC628DRAFT_1417226 [Trametes gibbosa]|uniref:Diphthamide biosynthesis protein 4 n=1 Tax=Trametes gibbosa TaxID=160864 RepID=A0A6G6FQD3_9APHY|nr:hypothetical protein BC628DRAFT_1417226 [Trametes gibbosa]QIE48505.1 hypothetical protein [Trametes gibbosa]